MKCHLLFDEFLHSCQIHCGLRQTQADQKIEFSHFSLVLEQLTKGTSYKNIHPRVAGIPRLAVMY